MEKKVNFNLKNILNSVSTIHGLKNINDLKGTQRIIWLILMLGNIILMTFILMKLKERYNDNQIVTQIDPNCNVRDVPFPAVTICNFNTASKREIANIVKLLKHRNRSDQEIQDFFRDTQHLRNFGPSSPSIPAHEEITAILKHHYFNMENVMEDIHQKCENLLLYCEYNGIQRDCTNLFSMIQTYEGYCCAFNYAALDEDDGKFMGTEEDFEYYYDQSTDETEKTNIIANSKFGRSSGLKVLIDIEPEDYPSWSVIPAYGAKVMISDPNDYPETTIHYKYVQLDESISIVVEPHVYYSNDALRKVSPEKRGCLFYDEVFLMNTVRYSYETCNTECKMRAYYEVCGCVPYVYPKGKYKVCELKDLTCLWNTTAYHKHKAENCEPPCFFECKDKGYSITSNRIPFTKEEFPKEVVKDRNITHLTSVHVYYARSTCNCYRQSLVIDFNFIVANYGGILSLGFGISILTIVEIFYLLSSTILKIALPYLYNVK